MFWWTDQYRSVSVPNFDAIGSIVYYALRVVEQLVIFAIPAFLFVSGYFVAVATGRTRNTIGYDVVWKRIKNLIIPFILWSVIILVLGTLAGGWLEIQEVINRFIAAPAATVIYYLSIILTGKATEAFYFVPVLIQLYLLAPLMLPWAKNRPWLLLALVGGLQLLVALLRYPKIVGVQTQILDWSGFLTTSWLFPGYIFWFGMGSVFGFHGSKIKPRLTAVLPYLIAALFVCFAVGMWEWETLLRLSGEDWIGPTETLVDQLYALTFLLVFIASEAVKLPMAERMSVLGTRSFGVYLVHTLALIYTARIIYNVAPLILGLPVVFQIVLCVMGLGIPLALMWALDRSPARRMYSYIFG